ncbi:MAG TPA: GrlR family regulatory protein [Candidatus Angelobacter sp.]
MLNGLWIAQYVAIQGSGGGVVVLADGKLLGGETGYTYLGTYVEHDGAFAARVRVASFLPDILSIVGIQGDYELEIRARMISDGIIRGTASLVDHPGAGLAIKLTKKADLA